MSVLQLCCSSSTSWWFFWVHLHFSMPPFSSTLSNFWKHVIYTCCLHWSFIHFIKYKNILITYAYVINSFIKWIHTHEFWKSADSKRFIKKNFTNSTSSSISNLLSSTCQKEIFFWLSPWEEYFHIIEVCIHSLSWIYHLLLSIYICYDTEWLGLCHYPSSLLYSLS